MVVISLFFSHSFSLSLENVTLYIASFLVFSFFYSAFHSRKIEKEHIFLAVLLILFVLSFFFILLFVFPSLSAFLPTLNLLTLSYGHSHFAAILLLVLPIVWWFNYSRYSELFRFKFFLVMLFYTLLLFTFGRLAIILSFLSLPFLLSKNFVENKGLKLFLLSLFLIVIPGLFFVSFSSDNCKTVEFKQQLCKPVVKEIRPEYFKQAVYSFFDYPLFGYGPGTFSLITKKYSQIGQHGSIYAHNFFLQTFSESGIVAGTVVLILLVSIFLRAVTTVISNRTRSIEYYLAIGFILIFANSLLDFDWNTFFIFQLSLLFAAGFLQSSESKNIRLVKLITLFWAIAALMIVTLGMVLILSKALLADSQANLLVGFFPYSRYQAKEIINDNSLNETNISKMMEIHKNDPDILFLFLEKINDQRKKIALYQKLVSISPWTTINTDYMKLLESEQMFEELGITAINGLRLINEAQSKGYVFRYEVKENVASYLNQSANYHLNIGDPQTAGKYYNEVLQVEKWTFHLSEPYFINQESITIKDVGILLNLSEADKTSFGKNYETFIQWFGKRVIKDILFVEMQDLKVYLTFISENDLWFIISSEIYTHMKRSTQEEGQPYVLWWYDFWYKYIQSIDEPNLIEKEYQYKLMNTLFSRGEEEKAKVIQEYLYNGRVPR